jgi:hypothetical protein
MERKKTRTSSVHSFIDWFAHTNTPSYIAGSHTCPQGPTLNLHTPRTHTPSSCQRRAPGSTSLPSPVLHGQGVDLMARATRGFLDATSTTFSITSPIDVGRRWVELAGRQTLKGKRRCSQHSSDLLCPDPNHGVLLLAEHDLGGGLSPDCSTG